MKNALRFIFHRIVFFVLFFALQIFTMFWVYLFFKEYFFWFYLVCSLFSIVLVLYIINDSANPAYKIAWMFPILLAPLFGSLFSLCPLRRALLIPPSTSLIRRSRMPVSLVLSVSISAAASSSAKAIPTMPGRFSVPARLPRS